MDQVSNNSRLRSVPQASAPQTSMQTSTQIAAQPTSTQASAPRNGVQDVPQNRPTIITLAWPRRGLPDRATRDTVHPPHLYPTAPTRASAFVLASAPLFSPSPSPSPGSAPAPRLLEQQAVVTDQPMLAALPPGPRPLAALPRQPAPPVRIPEALFDDHGTSITDEAYRKAKREIGALPRLQNLGSQVGTRALVRILLQMLPIHVDDPVCERRVEVVQEIVTMMGRIQDKSVNVVICDLALRLVPPYPERESLLLHLAALALSLSHAEKYRIIVGLVSAPQLTSLIGELLLNPLMAETIPDQHHPSAAQLTYWRALEQAFLPNAAAIFKSLHEDSACMFAMMLDKACLGNQQHLREIIADALLAQLQDGANEQDGWRARKILETAIEFAHFLPDPQRDIRLYKAQVIAIVFCAQDIAALFPYDAELAITIEPTRRFYVLRECLRAAARGERNRDDLYYELGRLADQLPHAQSERLHRAMNKLRPDPQPPRPLTPPIPGLAAQLSPLRHPDAEPLQPLPPLPLPPPLVFDQDFMQMLRAATQNRSTSLTTLEIAKDMS